MNLGQAGMPAHSAYVLIDFIKRRLASEPGQLEAIAIADGDALPTGAIRGIMWRALSTAGSN
jgi:hypothetical protein